VHYIGTGLGLLAVTASVIENERDISTAASLLHSLVPRAQVFCFYDRDAVCFWSSDSADDFEVDNFVADLPREVIDNLVHDNDVLRRTLPSGRTVLALPVPNQEAGIYGLLIALFSKNDGKSSSFSPSLLKSILDPAIEMIAESLRARSQNQVLERSLASVEKELEFVYEVDKQLHSWSERHTSMAQLVGRSGRYLGINYSVLLIPSKRIRISATHASWKNVNRKVLDRYLIDQLFPKLEGQRNPVIFEVPANDEVGAAETGYQTLLCPIMNTQGNIEGIFAQLGRVSGKKFNNQNRRFMSHIGRQVEYVIERSFDSMTGLMSRSGFEAQLRESYDSLKSDSDTHQLIYIDLDNLQLVNDTFDRKAGDDVILTFARLLEDDLPRSAVLSRLTGDDFCMLLTHVSSDEALEYANKLREKASALRYLEGDKSLQVTMSIGIAEFDRSSGVDGQVLTTARMACEAAKEHGRDRIEIYDEGNRSVVRRYDDMQLVAEIQQSLDGR
jgi:diguanylate cyclase (GGDEF)-like protein